MIDSAHFAMSELGHMNQVSATPPVRFIRFGLFEADLQAGELRKNGLKIKLQDQPFRVLSLLLERAGEVVTERSSARSSGRRTHSSTLTTASTLPSRKCATPGRIQPRIPRFVETARPAWISVHCTR